LSHLTIAELKTRIEVITEQIEDLRLKMLDEEQLRFEVEVSRRRMEMEHRRWQARLARLPQLSASIERIRLTPWRELREQNKR